MKISAQEEYGLRCLLRRASHPSGTVMTVREIAVLEGLSNAYVEKLLRALSRADLARSVRGTKGGYLLGRPADQIKLGEVLRALGGMPKVQLICHRFTGDRATCVHYDNCGIRSVWSAAIHGMEQLLDQTRLSDLVHHHHDEVTMGRTLQQRVGQSRVSL